MGFIMHDLEAEVSGLTWFDNYLNARLISARSTNTPHKHLPGRATPNLNNKTTHEHDTHQNECKRK
jgi:hypothetical protein